MDYKVPKKNRVKKNQIKKKKSTKSTWSEKKMVESPPYHVSSPLGQGLRLFLAINNIYRWKDSAKSKLSLSHR